jgi:hypothetical protein
MARRAAAKPGWFTYSWLGRVLLVTAVFVGVFGGIIWLGQWAFERIADDERYRCKFDDIACDPPPSMDRKEFLAEVRYESRLPDTLATLDDTVADRLRQAFAKHPWVRQVTNVQVGPAARISIALVFREPVLAVPVGDELRVVDGEGVLLPKGTPTAGLPRYDGKASAPRGAAGQRWGDTNVEQRARDLKAQTKT